MSSLEVPSDPGSRASLAIHGGPPVRTSLLPYGRQSIDEHDINAVGEALRSNWLTTGPRVAEFEAAFSTATKAAHSVAVSSGTAALHAAMFALKVGPGDEVIVPALTFAASANCVVYQGGTPVVVDVDPETLTISVDAVQAAITPRSKAVIAVDYAGQPCDYEPLSALARRHGLALVADACHALGGSYHGRPVGSLADLSTFSLHPVKPITTGEGGVVTCQDPSLAERMRRFRNHGITTDHRQRESTGSWFYEMTELGYNYRLTDVQCALGISQLAKLQAWTGRRGQIAQLYHAGLSGRPQVSALQVRPDVVHAYHLYVVRLALETLSATRGQIFQALRAEGIGVNVHYVPVHLHPYYRQRFGYARGMCPVAEQAYEAILSLPIFPEMVSADLEDCLRALEKVFRYYAG